MKKFIKTSLLFAVLFSSQLASCNKGSSSNSGGAKEGVCAACPGDNIIDHSLVVDHEDIKLLVGEIGTSKQIRLTVTPSTDSVTYSSTDTSVATVSNTGVVVGVKPNASCEIVIKSSSGIEKRVPVTTYNERTYFTYSGTNNDTLSGCIDNDPVELTLPKWWGGDESSNYQVKYLSTDALWGFPNLKKVVIPEGYTDIKKRSFVGLVNLEEVVFPSTVTTIESGSFYNCPNIKSIKFRSITTNSETGVEEETFVNAAADGNHGVSEPLANGSQVLYQIGSSNKSAILGFNRPNGLLFEESLNITRLGEFAFFNQDSMVDIQVPSTVSSLDKFSISGKNLKSVNLLCPITGGFSTDQYPPFVSSPNLETIRGINNIGATKTDGGKYSNAVITFGNSNYLFRASCKNFDVNDYDTFSGTTSGNAKLNGVKVNFFDNVFTNMGLSGVFKCPASIKTIRTRCFLFNSELTGVYLPKTFTTFDGSNVSSDGYFEGMIDPDTNCPYYIPKLYKGREKVSPFFGCNKNFKIYYEKRDDGKTFAEAFPEVDALLKSEYPNFAAVQLG